MLDAERRLVGGRIAEVARSKPVEGLARDIAGLAARRGHGAQRRLRRDVAGAGMVGDRVKIGDAAVGQFLALHMIEARGQPGRRAEPDRERRRDAPALLPDRIAAGDVLVVPHPLDPERGGVRHLEVHVAGDALVVGLAIAGARRAEILELRQARQDVDRAARRTASAERRIRAADNLDRVDREHFARLRGEIADAVDEDAALAVEAADEGAVADRIAALGRAEGNAGHGAQRIGKAVRTGLLDDLLWQDDHRTRRVDQRRDLLGASVVDALAVDENFFALLLVCYRGRGLVGLCGIGRRGGECADARQSEKRRHGGRTRQRCTRRR